MTQRTQILLLSIIALGSLGRPAPANTVDGPRADDLPDIRIAGVRILVPDMNKAIEFYSGVVGFGIRSMDAYPNRVVLKSDLMRLELVKTERPASKEYAGTVRTTFGFQTNDLLATRERLENAGVVFIEDAPMRVGIGIANTFHDPFGSVLYLLEQQVGDVEPIDEPRIFNVGFNLPSMATALRFYCDVLGFVVRTERYYPAIPLGYPDGSFAFMVHEETDLRPHAATYPDDAQVLIQFETRHLEPLVRLIQDGGATVLGNGTIDGSGGPVVAIRDPLGNVFELRERAVESSE